MKEDCLDIGIIQAFLDGELSHEETAKASSHMAECDTCAFAFAEAEDEAAIVFPALERELNTLVPTQRLWNKINESIEDEKRHSPWWEKAWGLVAITLSNPSLAAAASLIIVAGIAATFWINKAPVGTGDATNLAALAKPSVAMPNISAPASSSSEGDIVVSPTRQVERAAYTLERQRLRAVPAVAKRNMTPSADISAGEASYVNTISTLSKTVEEKKDDVFRPSQRVAFERDMALVNDTIAKMKQEVKRDPKNETARQVLYSSYQNKIDLLNSVAQREELMASIK